VTAVNAIGSSAPSAVFQISTPLIKPAAPTNVTVDDTTVASSLTVKWTLPTDFGGATVARNYYVDVSTNGGSTWGTYSVAGTATSLTIGKPGKGVTIQIRVATVTGYGRSDASNTVSYSVAATAPATPTSVRVSFGQDGNPVFAWNAPTDTGGSPITGYLVELANVTSTATSGSNGAITWGTPITVAGNVLSLVGVRGAPGSYHLVRVTAVNAIGNSPVSSTGSIMVPLLKPAAPGSFSGGQLTTGSTNVTLTWAAPSDLGGAAGATYQIERSLDNGVTWSLYGTTSALTASITGPAKGITHKYRVATKTGYGLSDYTSVVTVSTPVTVPSYPGSVSGSLTTDGSNQIRLTWIAPYDNGGSPITGYRVDRNDSTNTSLWSTVATTDANTLTAAFPVAAPGVLVTFRVYAISAIGTSTAAIVWQVRMAYVAPAATSAPVVTNSTNSTATTPRISINWTAASSFGGSSLSYYQLQQSTDGVTWVAIQNTAGTSFTGNKPVAGTRLFFRVVTYTAAGLTSASAVTTATF
jgi:titin